METNSFGWYWSGFLCRCIDETKSRFNLSLDLDTRAVFRMLTAEEIYISGASAHIKIQERKEKENHPRETHTERLELDLLS